ncbi:toxin-antitoxin system YwqK family antitoxin [Streptomyces sp. NPDC003247]|uniref:toxin-antitoxin system YwqK family antitoxin n=1 Tax=Streptomyces sp. NPDC003247 TaxID=3364677 RepID=UPI003692857D
MAEPIRIDIDDPEVDMDHMQRLLYRGALFTGEVVEHLGDALVSLEGYEDGLRHGPNQEWYKDGTLRSEGTARRGRPVGVSREWHANGTLASERVFADDGLTMLSDREWDENGQPTRAWSREDT